MHKVGAKMVEIVAKFDHPKMIVYTVFKRFEYCGIVEGQKSIGHLWKLLKCSIRILMRTMAIDCKQILVDITNCIGFDVSTSIIRKALHEVGFYNQLAQKKPFLNDAHRCRRLEFATQH